MASQQRNAETMADLKLPSIAHDLSSSRSTKRQKKSDTPTVVRCSLRIRGVAPNASTVNGLKDDLVPFPVKTTPSFSPTNLDKHFSIQDAYEGSPSEKQKHLIETIMDMCDGAPLRDSPPLQVGSSLDLGSMELKEENVGRVIPGSILSIKFLPCADRRVVVAGNKVGNVAFWDVDCEQGQEKGIYLYHPHPGPVSGLVIQPFALSKVFSSCYEGFVRLMDVNKESFELVYSSDNSLSCLAQEPHDMKSLYFGEGGGVVNAWDLRVGKSSSRWMLHALRIKTVDFNPQNSNLMATSSKDGTARIWDLRCIDETGSKYLKQIDHKKTVYSAYFSPSGTCLATTSLTDEVGILSGVDFGDTSIVCHNNQTGRWLSSFRGIWGWDDSHIFIGNMKKGVDVISTNDMKIVTTLESSLMTAIPCQFDAHPYKLGTLAGATSGGQIYIWTST